MALTSGLHSSSSFRIKLVFSGQTVVTYQFLNLHTCNSTLTRLSPCLLSPNWNSPSAFGQPERYNSVAFAVSHCRCKQVYCVENAGDYGITNEKREKIMSDDGYKVISMFMSL